MGCGAYSGAVVVIVAVSITAHCARHAAGAFHASLQTSCSISTTNEVRTSPWLL